jgi:DNA-binding Lrp family transcriptional regulator
VNDQHRNEFWMLETRLAEKARVSRASVSRAVTELVAAGMLERIAGAVKRGHPARLGFLFPLVAVVYETRLTMSRDDETRASPCDDTRLTMTQHAPHSEVQIPREPKQEPKTHQSTPVSFDAFWAFYPLKKDKGHARTAYEKALRRATEQEIQKGLERAVPTFRSPYIPLAATWLNGDRWEDEDAPKPTAKHWSEELAERWA